MNLKKSLGIWILFFLIVSFSYATENLVVFTESFGSDTFRSTTCGNQNNGNFTYLNYYNNGLTASSLTFDRIWYCLDDDGTSLFLNTTKAYDRTSVGLAYTTNGAKAGIMTELTETYKILNESYLEFSCRDVGLEIALVFGSFDDVIPTGRFVLNASTSAECSWGQVGSEWCSYIDFSCPVGSVKNVTTTFHNLFANGSLGTLGEQNLSSIDWIAIEFRNDAVTDTVSIDDIEIGFYNGSNLLPYYNLTTYYMKCKNESDDIITLIPNISVYDAEGDTVYYAYSDIRNEHIVVEYDFEENPYSIFSYPGFYSDTRTYENEDEQIEFLTQDYGYAGLSVGSIEGDIGLVLDRSGNFSFGTLVPMRNFTTINTALKFNYDSWLEILYYDGVGSHFLNLTFNYTDANLSIWADGTLLVNKVYPNLQDDIQTYLYVDVVVSNSTAFINGSWASIYSGDGSIDVSYRNGNGANEFWAFKVSELNAYDSSYSYRLPVYFDYIRVNGYKEYHNPYFVLSPNMEIDYFGTKYYNFYISDSENYPDKYVKEKVMVSVVMCNDDFVDSQIGRCTGFFPFLCLLERYVGNPLRSYYNADLGGGTDIDEYDLMESTGVWYIWFFMVISGIVIVSRGGNIIISPVVIGVSLILGLISYSVGFIGFAVSMMLIVSLFGARYVLEAIV